jgi:hypothetical protein
MDAQVEDEEDEMTGTTEINKIANNMIKKQVDIFGLLES